MENLIKVAIIGAISFLGDIKILVHSILILILIDLITGLWASFKLNGIKSFKSSKLKRTVIKTTCYIIAILTAFLLERNIFGLEGIGISRITAGFIALVEVASIFENLSKLSGMDLFLKIFDVIKTKFNTDKTMINKISGEEIEKE